MMKKIITTLGILLTIGFILIISSEWTFPSISGSHSLGNNLYMMDWDGGGEIIVYGTNIRGNTCYGGIYVVPSVEHNNKVKVTTAKSNDKWIIVKATQLSDNTIKYYLISKNFNPDNLDCKKQNCDSLLQSYISGPLDSVSFINKLTHEGINLRFSN